VWTWDNTGKRVFNKIPFKPYLYIESNTHKDATSIYNTSLRKVEFKNEFERRKYVQESGIKRIFYNIRPEQQFLIEQYGTISTTPEFSKNPLKIYYLDIEVDCVEFPNPKEAKDTINIITIYDSLTQKYYTWGLNNDYDVKQNEFYKKCITESELLKSFIKFWEHDHPDIVTGWNIEGFDIPYLMNRINNVLGEDYAKRLSPVEQLFCKEGVVKRFGKLENKWYIKGVSILDYLEVYKVFSREPRESYALNYIGEVELGEGKLAYNATSLSQLAKNDWQKFVEYNIQDVNIIVKLENKLQFLAICRMLAYMGLTSFESALGTIAVVTGAMAVKAQEKGFIIPTFNISHQAPYEGGFVKDPNRGLKEGIISFDANSLYPNTIITLNISPETKLGKIISKTDTEVTIKLVSGKEYTMPMDKFIQFIKKDSVAISKAKVLYSQRVKGFCPELVEGIYTERVKNKNQLADCKKSLVHCKEGSEKYIENKEMINHLDIMQYTLKILMNRIYGTFANKHSPFCDVDAAASITLTGQACIKEASNIINNYVKEKYDIGEDCNIYSDTDSCYFTIDPILKKIKKPFLNESNKISKDVYSIENEINNELNTKITSWAKNSLNSIDPRFVFKREAICDSAIFIQKKRYILHVLDSEGFEVKPEKQTKYVGVEIKRTDISNKIKPLIKDIVETILRTKDYKTTNDIYFKAFEKFKKMPLEDIAFPRGLHSFDKYDKLSAGFITGKGTPVHAKAAIYYNKMLDKLNLTGKYEKISGSAKIKWFYAQPNKYQLDCIGFANTYPEELKDVIKIDVERMFKKTIQAAIERLYEAINWKIKNPNSNEVNDLFELLA